MSNGDPATPQLVHHFHGDVETFAAQRRGIVAGWKLNDMIRLVRADADLLDAALAGDNSLAKALGHDVVPGWAAFREALAPKRDATASAGPSGSDWGPRFFVTDEPPELIGWGGFKGAPTDGVVELGYEIGQAPAGAWVCHRRHPGDACGGLRR